MASRERQKIAGRIGILSRWRPDDPELERLRARLDQLRADEADALAQSMRTGRPTHAEVRESGAKVWRLQHSMGPIGGEAA
jgi:hypothetical protein